MASDDPALFSATLQLSAFDLEVMQGEKGTQRSKLLLNKECTLAVRIQGSFLNDALTAFLPSGISLLRKRVEDPVLGVSDETIGSVLVLTIVEVSLRCVNVKFVPVTDA